MKEYYILKIAQTMCSNKSHIRFRLNTGPKLAQMQWLKKVRNEKFTVILVILNTFDACLY